MADAILTPAPAPLGPMESESMTGGLLRFTTAGSVDDGKSTLIGRLLYDTKSAYDDQIDSLRNSRINRSSGPMDLSLLTDGLRAEREQGITIDVAYRYFSTSRRKFIIADTPGHAEYTRNMATGASTAAAAVVLIDVNHGITSQSRRHAYIAHLLGIRHVVFAVNKMDMVAYEEAAFQRTRSQVHELSARLALRDAYIVPVSALEGDNVVRRSRRMPWFAGSSLLEYLETIPLTQLAEEAAFRLPIQYVIRPDATFRGFAGQIASGCVSRADVVVALPSGRKTRIRSIAGFGSELEAAAAGDSATVTLEDEIDLSRGDLLVSEKAPPTASRHVRANLVWMGAESLDRTRLYILKHTTRIVRARITAIVHRVDIDTLQAAAAESLAMNDIAAVELETTLPLQFDPYPQNRIMGSFILIDPISNATVAAGMIESSAAAESESCARHPSGRVSADERRARFGHSPAAVWIDDPQQAERFERTLFDEGWLVQLVPVADFRPSELIAIARALRLAGAAAVFSGAARDGRKAAVEKLFGSDAFFAGDRASGTQGSTPATLLTALRNWRAAAQQVSEKGAAR